MAVSPRGPPGSPFIPASSPGKARHQSQGVFRDRLNVLLLTCLESPQPSSHVKSSARIGSRLAFNGLLKLKVGTVLKLDAIARSISHLTVVPS